MFEHKHRKEIALNDQTLGDGRRSGLQSQRGGGGTGG